MTTFSDLNLHPPLLRAIEAQNYTEPTPIQAQAIPPLLAGKDVLGCAQTGTGKTAAFLLPILHRLSTQDRPSGKRPIRALVLTPTRELAAQIADNCAAYSQFTDLRHFVIYGGVKQNPQVNALRKGIDVLVATPGRLLDLHNQGFIDFRQVDFFVLDEADRMLDMGFIRDIRRVLDLLPSRRQNLLFSATMPDSITRLAQSFLTEPVRVEVDRQSTTVERITQKVMFVSRPDKKRLLRHLLHDERIECAIVFTRTKHGANRVVQYLTKASIESAAIHGNKSQGARNRALDGFKNGTIRVLVATDIASRGIDVDGITHVFNYDLPNISESYVHRIGRTGRAGREGVAIAFCDETETDYLRDIEDLIDQTIDVVEDHEWHCPQAMPSAFPSSKPKPRRPGGGGGRPNKGRSRRPQNAKRSARGGGGGRNGGSNRGGGRSRGRN